MASTSINYAVPGLQTVVIWSCAEPLSASARKACILPRVMRHKVIRQRRWASNSPATKSSRKSDDVIARNPDLDSVHDPAERQALLAIRELAKAQMNAASPNLTLPPFLRTRRDKAITLQGKTVDIVVGEEYGGIASDPDAPLDDRESEAERLRRAPFSERFRENHFAQALASPVRQDRLTSLHLPNFSLMAFHVVNEDDVEIGENSGAVVKRGSKAKSLMNLRFHPRKALADLFTRKSLEHMGIEDRKKVKAIGAEVRALQESYEPIGAASYLVLRYSLLKWISESPYKRAPLFWSIRFRTNLKSTPALARTTWQDDMHDYVLEILRKNVKVRFGGLLNRQTQEGQEEGSLSPKSPVLIPPFREGLAALYKIRNVAAVVRLKPAAPDTPSAHEAYTDKQNYYHGLKKLSRSSSSAEETAAEQSPEQQFAEESEWDEEAREEDAGSTLDSRGKNPFAAKYEGFLDDLKGLPPPRYPSPVYFPTVQYWNRRIPIYNLPFLMGEEAAAQIVEKTAFKDADYVVLRSTRATSLVLQSILKLHMYIAEGKRQQPKL